MVLLNEDAMPTPEEQAELDRQQQQNPPKVEFTAEQQEAVNKLINDRFAKITSKHELEVKRLKDEAEAARQLQTAPVTPPVVPPVADATVDQYKQIIEAEKLKVKNAEELRKRAEDDSANSKAEVLKVKKTQAMINAAAKQNFYELNTALKLTEDSIEYDEDSKNFVIKENGVVKQNNSLQPMTLEEYYTGFAAERPYLVNGDIKGGSGSAETGKLTGNNGLIRSKADLKTAKEKSDFISKFGYDKYEVLPLR